MAKEREDSKGEERIGRGRLDRERGRDRGK